MAQTTRFFIALLGILSFNLSLAKLVTYELRISYMDGYPDGVLAKHVLAVNGQFPGPTLEATVGDQVEIKMYNDIQDGQNTTLHWHGLHQRRSIFEDGVSMITQCPLASGHYMRYVFNATQAGTFWYHSHFHSQYTEGLFGPLIIHATSEAYDYYGEATLMLSDWYHRPAKENEKWYLTQQAFGQPPVIDSVLVNGMGQYNCPIALLQNLTCRSRRQMRPVIRVQRGKPYRLRVINAAARTVFSLSIAEQDLKVIEADGVDIAGPVVAHTAHISEGQRYSFLVQCPENSVDGSRYLIRTHALDEHQALVGEGIVNINKYPHAVFLNASAVLECVDEDLSGMKGKVEMTSEPYGWIPLRLNKPVVETPPGPIRLNEMDLAPLDGEPAPEHVDEEYMIEITFLETYDGDVRTPQINYTTFTYPEDKPLAHKLIFGEELTNEMLSVDIQYGNVIQLIINNPFANPHPFHLHGHHFWIVGLGEDSAGSYDPAKHNLTRFGVKRDTLMVPNFSWAVIRFVADNPGVWLFHCHLDWHAVGGMAMVFNEGTDILRERVVPTPESLKVCSFLNENKNPK